MASRSETRRKQAAPVKYDSEGKRITPGVKYDSEGKRINSNSTPQSTPRPTPKPTPKPAAKPAAKTPSSTAPVPNGGAALPTKGNSAMASLARSLIKNGVGRLIPGLGLVLTAVQVADYLGGDETEASKLANYGGQSGRDRRKQEEKLPPKPEPLPQRDFKLEDYGHVNPPPRIRSAMDAEERAGRAGEGRAGSGSSRPATVNTQSKKPIAKRIMEALGDKRTMERASEDARVTKEMEMEREMNVAGRKKGGMGQKKKDSVKKAYGGMVKKKQGGSANKVNMKAGFTRRGCSKG
jgi:hypothetical protein